MKINIYLFLFMISGICYSQIEKINLPSGYDFKIKYSPNNVTKIYSIYITKKGIISFERNRLSTKELGDFLFSEKTKFPKVNNRITKLLLYADINVDYNYIDAVKSAISSAKINSVYYRTNSLDDITKGLGLRNIASLFYKKELPLKNNPGDIIVDNIVEKHPIQNLQDELYNQNFNHVNLLLKKLKYKEIEFINGNEIRIGNKKVKLSNTESIYNEIKNLDFYFIKTNSKLKYGNYFKNISTIIKLYRDKKVDIPFIEVSIELQKILNIKNIKF